MVHVDQVVCSTSSHKLHIPGLAFNYTRQTKPKGDYSVNFLLSFRSKEGPNLTLPHTFLNKKETSSLCPSPLPCPKAAPSLSPLPVEYWIAMGLIAVISGLTCKRGDRANSSLY